MNLRMAWALTSFEAGRLLRSPILWGAAVLALGLAVAHSAAWLPDLTLVTIDTVTASSVVGAAAMISANLAAGRDRRNGLPETLGAVAGRAVARTRAVVLAAPLVGALVAALMIAVHLLYVWLTGPLAGRFDGYEALGGVALAAFCACAGAALARWTPWLIMTPLLIALLGFSMLANQRGEYAGGFLPLVVSHSPEWGPRPAGRHLAYLLAAAIVLGAAALLRHGLRPVRSLALLAALAVAVPAGTAASAATPWSRRPAQPAQVCQAREGLSYCVYPGYAAWIPVWGESLRPLLAAAPERARARLPVIRQFPADGQALMNAEPGLPITFTLWSTDPAQHRAMLLARVARTLTGLDDACAGGARGVVALWLVGRGGVPLRDAPPQEAWTDPRWNGQGWTEVSMGGNGALATIGQLDGARYGPGEVGYARRLLTRPDAADRVRAAWDRLTAPGATLDQALPLLGLARDATLKDTPCR